MAYGVDISEGIVNYSKERLQEARSKLSLTLPQTEFFVQNAFFINPVIQKYDRVLCGAECPSTHITYLAELLKVGGIMVVCIPWSLVPPLPDTPSPSTLCLPFTTLLVLFTLLPSSVCPLTCS
jgi:hypothetical protein